MKMKKVMALALAGVMALSIAACGGGSVPVLLMRDQLHPEP